jgi:hypothetical protein
MRSKIVVVILVVIAVIIGIGVGVGLLAGRGRAHGPTDQVQVVDNSTPPPTTTIDAHLPTRVPKPTPEVTPLVSTQSLSMAQFTNVVVALTNTTGSDTNWEEKIEDIVGSDDPDTNKVKQLFALFPKLPPDGQEEAAQHLSNLVDDEDYAPLGEMLKNDKLPEGVLDELLADALNRPNSLKLPALLQVASDANHVKHEEAKDLLELYLGEDYGSDWNTWRQHMTDWLQQNPD